jgi:methylenetetrahydrofolate--tRNA-(uracil-5-)-methyltransferase
MTRTLHIVGAGMAGSEAAWQAAELGVPVVLHEMRPHVGTFAHRTGSFAEMVCSNSFRSDDDERNAVGLLHWEMRAAGGLMMEAPPATACPPAARWRWTATPLRRMVTDRLRAHPLVTVSEAEVTELPARRATGSSPPGR